MYIIRVFFDSCVFFLLFRYGRFSQEPVTRLHREHKHSVRNSERNRVTWVALNEQHLSFRHFLSKFDLRKKLGGLAVTRYVHFYFASLIYSSTLPPSALPYPNYYNYYAPLTLQCN